MDNPNQTEATEDKGARNGRLTEQAMTTIALAIQQAEHERIYGKVAVELDFVGGVIQRIRRVLHVTEQ